MNRQKSLEEIKEGARIIAEMNGIFVIYDNLQVMQSFAALIRMDRHPEIPNRNLQIFKEALDAHQELGTNVDYTLGLELDYIAVARYMDKNNRKMPDIGQAIFEENERSKKRKKNEERKFDFILGRVLYIAEHISGQNIGNFHLGQYRSAFERFKDLEPSNPLRKKYSISKLEEAIAKLSGYVEARTYQTTFKPISSNP